MNLTKLSIEIVTSSFIAFLVNLFITRNWITIAYKMNLLAPDRNKLEGSRAIIAGGTWTMASISLGLLILEALRIYLDGEQFYMGVILALSLMASLSTLLGFSDDILSLKSYESRTNGGGVSPLARVVLMAPISLPLVAIKAGYTKMDLPIIGVRDLGLFYPLVLVPIGIIGASNAFNMLAGYNGLEAGMGILLLAGSLAVGIIKSQVVVIAGSLIGIASILGFLYYNWYPAKAFPGNSFTYGIGAYFAGLVIVGNFEKYGVAIFLLYFIEFALYLRSKLDKVKKINFALVCPDGSLKAPSDRVYSVTHLTLKLLQYIKNRKDCPTSVSEEEVVLFILLVQTLIVIVFLFILF